jgi:PAS domain S-box-containing protein
MNSEKKNPFPPEDSHPNSEEIPLPRSTRQDLDNALYHTLLDQEEFTFNTHGIVMSSNLEAVCITGYEEWEVIGKHFSLFYSPEDIEANQPTLDLTRAADNGLIHILGWRLKKNEKRFWAEITFQALLDTEKHVRGFKMTLQDAGHRVAANSRFKRLRNEYLNLFNNSFIGIYKYSFEDSCLLLMNRKAREIFDRDRAYSVYFKLLFEKEEEYEKLLGQLRMKRKVLDFEFQLKRRAGEKERWVSVSCRHFSEGNFVEGIVTDITQHKTHVLELERLNHELDGFTYHASHDLRAPLTTILGLVNLIKLEEPSLEVNRFTTMIQDRIFHLDSILKDLVSITNNNNTDVSYGSVDYESTVKLILGEFKRIYSSVRVSFEKKEVCQLYSDPVRVKAILRHLISNGMMHQNPESKNPTLNIFIETNDQRSVIVVEDNGVGILPEYREQIFEMFFRGTVSTKGTGLGLFIVKSSVSKLHGTIEVKSEYGKGSVFTVILPNHLNDE